MHLSIALPLAALTLTSSLPSQGQQFSVTEQVEVAVRTVTVVITDKAGRPSLEPPPLDGIALFEDGVRCEVLAIEPLRERPAAGTAEVATTAPATSVEHAASARSLRRQALYIDASFLRLPSVKEVAAAFARQADAVLALGPLEIVVADPSPRVFLAPTRDAAEVRAALETLGRKVWGRDRIAVLRQEAQQNANEARRIQAWSQRMSRGSGIGIGMPGAPSVRFLARQEAQLIEGGMTRLARWVTSSPRLAEGILYLASDGFDIDLSGYHTFADENTIENEIRPRLLGSVRDTRLALLAGGWTTVPIAVNSLSLSTFPDSAENPSGRLGTDANAPRAAVTFSNALEPLRLMADATGGKLLVAAGQLEGEVSRLSSAWLVTFRMTRRPDGRLHELKILTADPLLRVRAVAAIPAGTTTSTSAARVLDALEAGAPAGPLPVALAFTGAGAETKGRRRADMHLSVRLDALAPLLARVGRARVRISVAVEVPGTPPFVSHDDKEIGPGLPRTWIYDAPVVWPKAARRIAVVAEELTTGSAGSAVAELSDVR